MSNPKDIQISGRVIEYPSNDGIEASGVNLGTSATFDFGGTYKLSSMIPPTIQSKRSTVQRFR